MKVSVLTGCLLLLLILPTAKADDEATLRHLNTVLWHMHVWLVTRDIVILTHGRFLIILIAFTSISAWGDVKTKQEISSEAEYAAGHIQGAQWFPRGKLEYYIQDVIKDPNS